ncbi:hypothetical protein Tco_0988568 [Tanacetum coccineum]|uniref:Tf2-1-like SH3-like domain-containing protein n=1 Tax=Tanacetum coccineum TaxID=301880 RepID=A0ABQ5ERN3_9ASTR
MVLLKVSPWKGAVRFRKRVKLSPRYIGPFKIIARVGLVAYTLELHEELKGIHSTFHVLNLKKCLAEGDVVVPMEEIQLDDKLHMIEEPVEIVDKEIIMANVNHDDEVPVVEPNQHNDVPVVPEPVLEDEDEDPKEEEFEEEEEDPQEDEDDMEIDIEEDENEPELTYPYEETDSLNPSPPASESEPDNEIEVENLIEHEDETVPVSVYETAYALVEKKSEAKDKFYGKLILDLGNEVHSIVDQGTAAMERLVEKLGNVKEKAECKKLKKELEEAKLSNTFLHISNEAIDVLIEDVKSSSPKEIMPPKSAHMTQAAMRRMIKESVDAAIAVERERQAKVKNDASGSVKNRYPLPRIDDLFDQLQVIALAKTMERIKFIVDEEIERLRKRKRENKDESASANGNVCNVPRFDRLLSRETGANDGNARFLSGSNVVVESFKLLKELHDDELEKSREMMKLISETQLQVLKKISFIDKLHCQ